MILGILLWKCTTRNSGAVSRRNDDGNCAFAFFCSQLFTHRIAISIGISFYAVQSVIGCRSLDHDARGATSGKYVISYCDAKLKIIVSDVVQDGVATHFGKGAKPL